MGVGGYPRLQCYLISRTNRTIQHFDLAGGMASFFLSESSEGIDIYAASAEAIVDDDSEALVRLSVLNDELLSEAALPTFERIHFKNDDGDEIEGLVHLPDDFDLDDLEARPLITDVRGGPTTYDAPCFEIDYAYWTGCGYIVLDINYGGSTSYGRAFSEGIRGE